MRHERQPDGYTLYLATDGPLTVAAFAHKNLSYHWKRDFLPVTMLAVSYQVMLVQASDPARNLQEFIANARQRPGQLNYGSIGLGSAPHLAAEMVKSAAQIDLLHVPYRGSSAQAMTAMIAGEISMLMNGTASSMPHIHGGKLRGLAVALRRSGSRACLTFRPLRKPDCRASTSFCGSRHSCRPARLRKSSRSCTRDLVQATSQSQLKKALETRGLEVRTTSPEQLGEFMERE